MCLELFDNCSRPSWCWCIRLVLCLVTLMLVGLLHDTLCGISHKGKYFSHSGGADRGVVTLFSSKTGLWVIFRLVEGWPWFWLLFVPEPTARSAVRRGLLIPHGYLHPGKSKHTAKCKVHQWLRARRYGSSFMGGHLTDLINMADRQEWKGQRSKKYMKERLHNTKKSFFNLPLKDLKEW